MPRTARNYLNKGYYHVIIQGLNREYIFLERNYKKKYLEFMKKFCIKLQVKVIAYCIMSNHAHFLIKTESIENLSSLMQTVNSNYAKYYNYTNNRVGYVFRDRFLSEPITNHKYFIQCIKYIHLNPIKAHLVKKCEDYEFSSYKYFQKLQKSNLNNHLYSNEDFNIIFNNSDCKFNFIDIEKNTKEHIELAINTFLTLNNIKVTELFCNRIILKKLIKYLNKIEKIKYIEIRNYLELTRGIMDSLKE